MKQKALFDKVLVANRGEIAVRIIKTLKKLSPQSLSLFKNEFRSLADIYHPNLIRLYELLHERDLWFLSMELLRGQELFSFVCHSSLSFANTQTMESPALQTSLGFPRR